jgi:hypothetical protein
MRFWSLIQFFWNQIRFTPWSMMNQGEINAFFARSMISGGMA